MSLPILNILENLGVPNLASEILILNEPFDWSNTNEIIEQIEERLISNSIDLNARKKIIRIVTEALDNVCKHAIDYPSQHVSSFICHLDTKNKLYL
jgi:glucose-6-phosphate-specific signal transduction histidine kinase